MLVVNKYPTADTGVKFETLPALALSALTLGPSTSQANVHPGLICQRVNNIPNFIQIALEQRYILKNIHLSTVFIHYRSISQPLISDPICTRNPDMP